MLLRILVGALLGACCAPLYEFIVRRLLSARNRTLNASDRELWILRGLLVLIGALTLALEGFTPKAAYALLLLITAACISVIDAHERIIPNELVLAVMALSLLFGLPGLCGLDDFPVWHRSGDG